MEILQVADTVAREKSIDREEVIGAMEEAIQKAARSKYGQENDIRAIIDRNKGTISLHRYREVVATIDDIENDAAQLPLEDAVTIQKDIKVGEFLIDDLPPIDFGRIAAQTAKQVITQRVRDAERARQFEEYKDRAGEVINGTVKRADYGSVTVDLGRAEATIRKEEGIPRERLRAGDRVRALILSVSRELRGPQIFLSRTHPDFMAKLFKQEVPEIYEGVIDIKAVARDPGSRAKIAVYSHDSSIDPVGACVGMRGSRVQAVVNELQGEKIDIIPYTEDTASFIVSALQPAEVTKVVMDEETKRVDVVVPEDHLSLAIGRRGQNVRLASMLTGWDIDIMTEEEQAEKRAGETKRRTELFMAALDVDDVIAHLLVAEGFVTVDDVAYIELFELSGIEGFNDDIAQELQDRARAFCEKRDQEMADKIEKFAISEELLNHAVLSTEMVVKLGENDVKTLDDLGDLSGDELVEILGEETISLPAANSLIMEIRDAWFAEEEAKAQQEAEANAEDADKQGTAA